MFWNINNVSSIWVHCLLLFQWNCRLPIACLSELSFCIFDNQSSYFRKCTSISRILLVSFSNREQRAECFQIIYICHLKVHCSICHRERKYIPWNELLCYNECIQNAIKNDTFFFTGARLNQRKIRFTLLVIFQLVALFDALNMKGI